MINMLSGFSSRRIFVVGTLIIVVFMSMFLYIRIEQAQEQMEFNLNERADDVLQRVSSSVSPTVWNIYQKSTGRFYSQTTASAILDSELSAMFLIGINVYGNFGHLFMGRLKDSNGKIIPFSNSDKKLFTNNDIHKKSLPVVQGKMTIGRVEVYYSSASYLPGLRKIYFFECLQIIFITSLIILSLYLVVKTSQSKNSVELALNELQNTQEQLIESEKLASLGSLVAGVSHEINTPLGVIVTLTSMVLERNENIQNQFYDETLTHSTMKEYLEEVDKSLKLSTHSLNRVIDLLKSFKHIAADQMMGDEREINLTQYIKEVMSTLSTELKKNRIQYQFNSEKEILISTVPGAVAQVLTNLVTNSIRHGFENKKKRNISINIIPNGTDATIIYEDNGSGMTSDVLDKIYEPFFTTKRNKGGIGLGMNIVYNSVKKTLQGDIKIDSTPGIGTRFTIFLPKMT
ncbi:MAG: HAMP domain-containing histidine kinase [Gammaproteobacteria bacterium]|nr:HAMP domain-containing histidine kinase [Gammaproteobacteria bacterium]